MVVWNPLKKDGLEFCWLGSGEIPAHLDLRNYGWILNESRLPGSGFVGIVDGGPDSTEGWQKAFSSCAGDMRRGIMIAGVDCPDERVMLIQMGFGDVVSKEAPLGELAARARKIADSLHWMPRWREFGELKLDLIARDAYGRGKPLNLNAREFTLLWRLADDPNRTVSKQALMKDVWRMGFVPKTNSIAVHMSRLRQKLARADFKGIIETAVEGGYRLRIETTPANGVQPKPSIEPSINAAPSTQPGHPAY